MLPVVTLESLVADYGRYENQEIVIAAVVVTGLETSLIYLPIPSPPGQAHAMWVTLPRNISKKGSRVNRFSCKGEGAWSGNRNSARSFSRLRQATIRPSELL
jgi:hypothetical protein